VVKAEGGSGVQNANTTAAHSSVTREAAVGTGWERVDEALVESNLAQDGSGASFFGRLKALATNEDHFGRLSDSLGAIRADVDRSFASSVRVYASSSLLSSHAGTAYVEMVSRAAHLIQDHLTLGHMVPGASLFAGPLGAPVRLVIHQVFGGEIAFRQAQIRATRDLLNRYAPWVEI